jgi:hypothetical protein
MGRTENSGAIVEYTRKDGTTQRAIMRHSDQTPQFSLHGHAFLRLVDADMKTVSGQSGKESIAIKPLNELRRIGFID